jgi:molecular chaperone DnaJ
MAAKKDYYELLGVPRDASPDDIKKAFRKLAFQYHPDHNHHDGASDRFKEINEAYQVLSDAQKRAHYDHFGHMGSGRGFEGLDDFFGLGDIFDAFFSGAAATRRRSPQPGADLHYQVEVSFEEAAFGTEKRIDVLRTGYCSRCQGKGGEPGTSQIKCPACGGLGEVRRVQQSVFGRFVNRAACDRCHGDGAVMSHPCVQCQGAGREKGVHTVNVTIPAGVSDRHQIRLKGEGDVGTLGGNPGSLYLNIAVQRHAFFTRDGNNIVYDLSVNFAQAALGDEVEVPTLEGKARLKISPGTQTDTLLSLKGKGIPYLDRQGRGDQLVRVKVVTPEKLSDEQRRIFVELAGSLGQGKTGEQSGKKIMDRFKKGLK